MANLKLEFDLVARNKVLYNIRLNCCGIIVWMGFFFVFKQRILNSSADLLFAVHNHSVSRLTATIFHILYTQVGNTQSIHHACVFARIYCTSIARAGHYRCGRRGARTFSIGNVIARSVKMCPTPFDLCAARISARTTRQTHSSHIAYSTKIVCIVARRDFGHK